MEVASFSFGELELWKKARVFKNEIRKLANGLPAEEKYRLTDQLIRCTRRFNSNFAEGYGRYTYADQIHFCIQSRGSLYEAINHLIDAFDDGLITGDELNQFKQKAKEIEIILNGYIKYLRGQKRPVEK